MADNQERSGAGSPIYRHAQREREFELALGKPDEIHLISEHIAREIGPVDTVFHELLSDLVHVDVHHVPPGPDRPFHTLVTTGMSERPMNTPPGAEDYRFAEMVVCLPPDWPLTQEAFADEANYWPIRWLKLLTRLPHEYRTWLSAGHTVPNGDPPVPFASNTEMCCALLYSPQLFGPDFCELELSPDKIVNFLAFVPLHRDEMEFKLQKGYDRLVDLLDQARVTELLQVGRPSVCSRLT